MPGLFGSCGVRRTLSQYASRREGEHENGLPLMDHLPLLDNV